MDYVPMTREAYDRKKVEIARLENEVMPKIAEKIAEAREEGDLKENAEYHAQREEQGKLQAKINQEKGKLARANIIDMSKIDRSTVSLGATVVCNDLDLDDEETYTFVGAGDEDYMNDRYLITSPVGLALAGHIVGDTVEVEIPTGMLKLKITEIRYEELD
jgi:transcription elongation factor GreA